MCNRSIVITGVCYCSGTASPTTTATAAPITSSPSVSPGEATCVPYGSDPFLGKQVTFPGGIDGDYSVTGGEGGQFSQGDYVFGTFDRIEGNVAFYIDQWGGCEAKITFDDDCSLPQMMITSVSDESMCNRSIVITGVCYCSSPLAL